MTNAQTIEVSTRQIDYAQCAPAPRLAAITALPGVQSVDVFLSSKKASGRE